MSEDTRVTGEIRIDPPLTWREIADSRWLNIHRGYDRDALLRVVDDRHDTDTGQVVTRTADAIIPERMHQSAYHLTEHVQAIVDEHGEGHTFSGFLDCIWGGGQEHWRLVVRDGRAVEVRPQVVWPADASDGQEVSS